MLRVGLIAMEIDDDYVTPSIIPFVEDLGGYQFELTVSTH